MILETKIEVLLELHVIPHQLQLFTKNAEKLVTLSCSPCILSQKSVTISASVHIDNT